MRSSEGGPDARAFIAELIRFVAVADCGTNAVAHAVRLEMDDFEDAMKVAAARACGARFVVTRNVRDFKRSPIPAITPVEALEVLFWRGAGELPAAGLPKEIGGLDYPGGSSVPFRRTAR